MAVRLFNDVISIYKLGSVELRVWDE